MKTVKCPICSHALENVEVADDEKVIFNRPLKELPLIVWCDNCKRKIRYQVEKIEEVEKHD